MIFWITSTDGSVNFKTEAPDAPSAFDLLGRSLGYLDFETMCGDLNYRANDFRLASIEIQPRGEYDETSDRANIDQQKNSAVTGAFRQIRKMANQ